MSNMYLWNSRMYRHRIFRMLPNLELLLSHQHHNVGIRCRCFLCFVWRNQSHNQHIHPNDFRTSQLHIQSNAVNQVLPTCDLVGMFHMCCFPSYFSQWDSLCTGLLCRSGPLSVQGHTVGKMSVPLSNIDQQCKHLEKGTRGQENTC